MSGINDFREWLDSNDPRIVRSLVLDAYATDRKFVKTFEKIIDADFTSITGTAWWNLFRAEHDWAFFNNSNILLDASLWDEGSKDTFKGILHIIADFLNINWLPDVVDIEKDSSKSISETWWEDMEDGAESREISEQAVDNHLYPREFYQDEVSANKDQYGNHNPRKATPRGFKRDRRGQLIQKSWKDMSSNERTEQRLIQKSWKDMSSSERTEQRYLQQLKQFAVAGGLLITFIVLGIVTEQKDSGDIYESQESSNSEEINEEAVDSSLANLPDPNFMQELSDTRKLQSDAVLICEYEPVIVKLNNLRLRAKKAKAQPYYESVATDLINQSKQQISSLKRDGKYGEYFEDSECTSGFQWFDTDADNAHRAFLVVSRKCDTSSKKFLYTDKNDKTIETISLNTSHLQGSSGEILVPYGSETAETVSPVGFICN